MHKLVRIKILTALLLAHVPLQAAPHSTAVQSNQFAQSLVTVSEHLAKGRDVIVEVKLGGYSGVTNNLEFYREITTRERDSGKLISKILWENNKPDNLHGVEVYVYDEDGRLLREYQATYLPYPDMRKAPYFTQLVRHVYIGDLHVTREFDANGWPLYEDCHGRLNERQISIGYEYEESPNSPEDIEDPQLRADYRACFGEFPNRPGPFTNPLVEIED